MELRQTEISSIDFTHTERTTIQYTKRQFNFPSPGAASEFGWKDYSPTVFRHIQMMDDIDYSDYMICICGHEVLSEIATSTRPGTTHYLSRDSRFVIKTLRKSEVKVLREMLPNYYRHITKYGASLLTKLYGLHVVRPNKGLKVYFAVMSNVLKSDVCLHLRYDLKGSSQGRTVNKGELYEKTMLKDADLDFCFYMDPLMRHRLLAQIKYDCEFLEAEGIMDYSLLLGIHVESPYQASARSSNASTAYEDSPQTDEDTELTISDICDPSYKPGFKFGVKMPARALRTPRNNTGSVSSSNRVKRKEWYDAYLYFGIVDILQNYNVSKRIEHAYKSLQYNSKSISAVNPRVYSSRFQEFLGKVFQENDSDL